MLFPLEEMPAFVRDQPGLNMHLFTFLFTSSLLLLGIAGPARADIWECIDSSGNKRFTNVKAEAAGCKPMNLPPVTSVPAPKPAAKGDTKPQAAPGNFPKVDAPTQQQRDGERRKILEQELANEQKLLELAKKDLAEQEATRLGSERNYQRVLERLEPFKKKVTLHENNVTNLRKELSSLR
jgi:Domain of unknown function (DUF4124)